MSRPEVFLGGEKGGIVGGDQSNRRDRSNQSYRNYRSYRRGAEESGEWVGPGSGIGGWGDLTRGLGGVGVLEAGLEPARPLWPKDFKSFVSTIPPFERVTGEGRGGGCCGMV